MFEPGSIAGGTITLAVACVGVGTVAFPLAFAEAGMLLSVGLLFGIGIFTVLSIRNLAFGVEVLRLGSYEDMARVLLGKRFEDAVRVMLLFLNFGVCVGYVVVLNEMLQAVRPQVMSYMLYFSGATDHPSLASVTVCHASSSSNGGVLNNGHDTYSWWYQQALFAVACSPYLSTIVLCTFWLVILYPLSLAKSMDSLRFASSMAILSTCFIMACVVYRYFIPFEPHQQSASSIGDAHGTSLRGGQHTHGVTAVADHVQANAHQQHSPPLFRFNFMMLLALPIMMYSLDCQCFVFQIYNDLNPTNGNRSMWGITTVAFRSTMVACTFFFGVGAFGSLSFGDSTRGNILQNYDPLHDPLFGVGYLLYSFPVVMAFVFTLFPCRDAVFNAVYGLNATNLAIVSESPPSPTTTSLVPPPTIGEDGSRAISQQHPLPSIIKKKVPTAPTTQGASPTTSTTKSNLLTSEKKKKTDKKSAYDDDDGIVDKVKVAEAVADVRAVLAAVKEEKRRSGATSPAVLRSPSSSPAPFPHHHYPTTPPSAPSSNPHSAHQQQPYQPLHFQQHAPQPPLNLFGSTPTPANSSFGARSATTASSINNQCVGRGGGVVSMFLPPGVRKDMIPVYPSYHHHQDGGSSSSAGAGGILPRFPEVSLPSMSGSSGHHRHHNDSSLFLENATNDSFGNNNITSGVNLLDDVNLAETGAFYMTPMTFYLWSSFLSLAALVVAVLTPGIVVVIGLLGAMCSSTLCFTYPALYRLAMDANGFVPFYRSGRSQEEYEGVHDEMARAAGEMGCLLGGEGGHYGGTDESHTTTIAKVGEEDDDMTPEQAREAEVAAMKADPSCRLSHGWWEAERAKHGSLYFYLYIRNERPMTYIMLGLGLVGCVLGTSVASYKIIAGM